MVRAIELLNGQELPSLEPGQLAKKLLVGGSMLHSLTVFLPYSRFVPMRRPETFSLLGSPNE